MCVYYRSVSKLT